MPRSPLLQQASAWGPPQPLLTHGSQKCLGAQLLTVSSSGGLNTKQNHHHLSIHSSRGLLLLEPVKRQATPLALRSFATRSRCVAKDCACRIIDASIANQSLGSGSNSKHSLLFCSEDSVGCSCISVDWPCLRRPTSLSLVHAMQVTSMQWSPILPSNSTGTSSSHAHSRGSHADPHRHAAKLGHNEQLALMTVGADRLIRVWVEVKMQDLLPSHLMRPARGEQRVHVCAHAASRGTLHPWKACTLGKMSRHTGSCSSIKA